MELREDLLQAIVRVQGEESALSRRIIHHGTLKVTATIHTTVEYTILHQNATDLSQDTGKLLLGHM